MAQPDAKLAGVILAAGESTRMGRDKALLPWKPGGTLLAAAIAALRAHCGVVIVVAGRNLEALRAEAAAGGAALAHNPEPERGQFSSLQTGLRAAVERGCDAVMIAPVDCPPLSEASLQRLRAEYASAVARGCWAVAPVHAGKRGHPLLAAPDLVAALLAAPMTSNARAVLHARPERLAQVEVAERLGDLDTPEQLQEFLSRGAS